MPQKRVAAPAVPTRCLAETVDRRNAVCLGGKYLSLSKMMDQGLNHTYMSRIARGLRIPSYAYAKRIALVIGVLDAEGQPDPGRIFQLLQERRIEIEQRQLELEN